MPPNSPTHPAPPVAASVPPPRASNSHWLLYGCGSLIALLLLLVATVLITLWWIQRPIKPVVLSTRERATVDEKIQRLNGGAAAPASAGKSTMTPGANVGGRATTPPSLDRGDLEAGERPDRTYVPGSKALKITEREINGLLNANTDLGKSVRLEFAQDAINAYVAVRIPEDFPVGGGKMFRARGRFRVSLGNGGEPYAILEDVTVFGLSLPKAWLGGLKGQNLIGQAVGERKQWALKGVKSVRVEPGALVLEVED